MRMFLLKETGWRSESCLRHYWQYQESERISWNGFLRELWEQGDLLEIKEG